MQGQLLRDQGVVRGLSLVFICSPDRNLALSLLKVRVCSNGRFLKDRLDLGGEGRHSIAIRHRNTEGASAFLRVVLNQLSVSSVLKS